VGRNVAQKLIESHLVSGEMRPGEEIGLRIDQTLTQDATGTLVMLELEAMELERVHTEVSVQYVDHNLLQTDERNADDHLFLYSSCRRFGIWFSKPGNGVSHPVHQSRFGVPGKSMAGSDSHTCAAGSIGMLAFGTGGLEVAMAMIGEPLYIRMPKVWGVELVGELPPWVSAKDVVLEMLRRHDVKGGRGRILEYHGPGLAKLGAWDRHVIANMGAELGATTTVFPSDDEVKRFLASEDRESDWTEIVPDADATYDIEERIDLSTLVPLIAQPTSPGNVVPVQDVAGAEIYQVVVGSSANPGFRDFAVASKIVEGRQSHPRVSFDVNPTSRQILEELAQERLLLNLIHAGARVHQSGCMGCIGMGQAPATGHISLRTMPRNFPGRSGTRDDLVYLCSPETAAASALTGRITDPRELEDLYGMSYPKVEEPRKHAVNTDMLVAPLDAAEAKSVELIKSSNIVSLPSFEQLPDALRVPVLLKMGDNVSTDEIMPAGQRVLPLRSNVPAISEFAFVQIDESYPERARESGDHAVVAGSNYGQGSSREHAAVAPRYLGLRVVIAKDYARIHWQNLPNFGVLPLSFVDPDQYEVIETGDVLEFERLRDAIVGEDPKIDARNATRDEVITLTHTLSPRQVEMILDGGLINTYRREHGAREMS
jgi:aconitate hydratase